MKSMVLTARWIQNISYFTEFLMLQNTLIMLPFFVMLHIPSEMNQDVHPDVLNSFIICTAATSGLLYQPQMIGEGDCGASGGMKIGRGNRSTRRKSAPVPLCPPQIPLDQTRDRTRAAAVGSQQLNA
jgi:hypothetical protein